MNRPSRLMIRGAQLAAACVLILACAVLTAAQARAGVRAPPPTQTAGAAAGGAEPRGDADEDFELNIGERRITEQDFFASTEIAAGDAETRGLSLRVGVAVGAERIDVLLRNVRGRVRFRGSLDALRRVLDARRATNVAPPAQPPEGAP